MMARSVYFALFAMAQIVASTAAAETDAEQAGLSRGAALLHPYKQGLQSALQAGMSKGVVEAISACQVQAPEIARGLSQDDVRVGRSSHRLRNPDNTPPEWVKPILDTYLASPADREPESVSLSKGRAGYVEPIMLQPLCSACHGSQLSPEVAAQIDALYPEDQARGFAVGEFRGVFWAEYPAEP